MYFGHKGDSTRHWTLNQSVTAFWKTAPILPAVVSIPLIHWESCFQVMRQGVRQVNFIGWSQWMHILVVRRCTKLYRNTMITDNTFCESKDGGPGRGIGAGKANPYQDYMSVLVGKSCRPMMAWVPSYQPTMKWSLLLEG